MSAVVVVPLFAAGNPGCCSCDPAVCESDDSGSHCEDRSCGVCLFGCPAASDADCCQTLTAQEATQ